MIKRIFVLLMICIITVNALTIHSETFEDIKYSQRGNTKIGISYNDYNVIYPDYSVHHYLITVDKQHDLSLQKAISFESDRIVSNKKENLFDYRLRPVLSKKLIEEKVDMFEDERHSEKTNIYYEYTLGEYVNDLDIQTGAREYILEFKTPNYLQSEFNISFSDKTLGTFDLDPVISACGNLAGGNSYTLDDDLYFNDTTNCLVFNGNNIHFDCQGNKIHSDGGTTRTAFYSSGKTNITITNCVIENMGNNAIYFSTSHSASVLNTVINQSTLNGIFTQQSNYFLVDNVSIYSTTNGVYVYDRANHAIIQNSYFNNIKTYSIYGNGRSSSYKNTNLTIYNNNVVEEAFDALSYAIYVINHHNILNISYNNIEGGFFRGIHVSDVDIGTASITNNDVRTPATRTTSMTFYIGNSQNSTIENNIFCYNDAPTPRDIYLNVNSHNNTGDNICDYIQDDGTGNTVSCSQDCGVLTAPTLILETLDSTLECSDTITLDYSIQDDQNRTFNCSIYADTNPTPTTNINWSVISNTITQHNVSYDYNNNDNTYYWYVKCDTGALTYNTDTYIFYIDSSNPDINITSPSSDYSVRKNYSDNFELVNFMRSFKCSDIWFTNPSGNNVSIGCSNSYFNFGPMANTDYNGDISVYIEDTCGRITGDTITNITFDYSQGYVSDVNFDIPTIYVDVPYVIDIEGYCRNDWCEYINYTVYDCIDSIFVDISEGVSGNYSILEEDYKMEFDSRIKWVLTGSYDLCVDFELVNGTTQTFSSPLTVSEAGGTGGGGDPETDSCVQTGYFTNGTICPIGEIYECIIEGEDCGFSTGGTVVGSGGGFSSSVNFVYLIIIATIMAVIYLAVLKR